MDTFIAFLLVLNKYVHLGAKYLELKYWAVENTNLIDFFPILNLNAYQINLIRSIRENVYEEGI
jgi:hypothetical protein